MDENNKMNIKEDEGIDIGKYINWGITLLLIGLVIFMMWARGWDLKCEDITIDCKTYMEEVQKASSLAKT